MSPTSVTGGPIPEADADTARVVTVTAPQNGTAPGTFPRDLCVFTTTPSSKRADPETYLNRVVEAAR